VLNAHNTVFGSKRSAICAIVELSCNVFFELNDLHISIHLYLQHEERCRYAIWHVSSKKQWNSC